MGTCTSTIDNNGLKPLDDSQALSLDSSTEGGPAAATVIQNEVMKETGHPILRGIEKMQQESGKPFGRILDAGTGLGSFNWLAHLLSKKDEFGVEDWTAVTASEVMAKIVAKEAKRLGVTDPEDHLVLGNWFDSNEEKSILQGEAYDTILVDYLIGAMDAFSPYLQDCIFDRLAKLLKPGGRIYLIGTEPIPENDADMEKNLVCRVKNMRDACILLTGDRCYREYPLSWTLRQMNRCGLNVVESSHQQYKLLHRVEDLHDQIGVGRSMLKKIPDRSLASSMEESLHKLEFEARRVMKNTDYRPIHLGFDYLVVAQRPL